MSRLVEVLNGTKSGASCKFSSLPVGAPFKWVKYKGDARSGVCVKVTMSDGKFKFPHAFEDEAWMPMENENVGIIFSDTDDEDVIPLL